MSSTVDRAVLVKKLYIGQKLSMKKVSDKLGISIDAVLHCMRKNNISRRSFTEANAIVFQNKKLSFKEKVKLSEKEKKLKIAGLMLYWGEGYKSLLSHGVDFANSDPVMIKVFINFLRTVYGVDEKRFRILLYCYSNQNVPELINFWSKLTLIPKKQFSKPYIRTDFKENGRKMKYGMIHLRYADKKLLFSIMDAIDILKKECVGTQAVNGDGL